MWMRNMDRLSWLLMLKLVLCTSYVVLIGLVCVKGSEANGRRARVWFRHPRKYGRIFAGDVESPSLMPLLLLLLCCRCLLLVAAAVAAACCCRCCCCCCCCCCLLLPLLAAAAAAAAAIASF